MLCVENGEAVLSRWWIQQNGGSAFSHISHPITRRIIMLAALEPQASLLLNPTAHPLPRISLCDMRVSIGLVA